VEENLGEIPDRVLADPGYFSEENVESVVRGFVEPFIPAIAASTPMRRSLLPAEEFLKTCLWWIGCCANSRQRRGEPLTPRERKV